MKKINWNIPKRDALLIAEIVKRASQMDLCSDALGLNMDLTACHANGTPLNLDCLLRFPDFEFAHDIDGIRRHINRETGQIEGCFLPRCAAPSKTLATS